MMHIKVLCIIIFLSVAKVHSARILGIIYMPTFSHQIVLRPLWKELSLRGHQLTVITTDPVNDPLLTNVTEIDIKESYNLLKDFSFFKVMDIPFWKLYRNFSEINAELIDIQLSIPNVKKLIDNPNEHFDLLIIEGLHSAYYAFAERFKCPFISVITLEASAFVYHEIGNPTHYALHPDYSLSFQKQLTFPQRLLSLFNNVYFQFMHYYFIIPAQQRLVKKHFGENYAEIKDVYKNYSIFFINSNSIIHLIRPLLPNVVQIWGKIHITKNKALPQKLQNILDQSKDGVIYFSLGSNIKSKHISKETLRIITTVFKELPFTILWKFEDENLPNKPDNVIISKWFPQQDVLRHPNIKLFITQGGLQSFEEALYANLPIIGIPVMGDQRANVQQMASMGLGVLLEYKSITKETFKSAILEVIENPKYRNTVKLYAELAADQFETGIERAVWWTEFVLRHKGATHLRNPALDLPTYQYYSLDVIGLSLSVILFFLYLAFKIILVLLRLSKTIHSKSKQKQM